MQKEGQAATQLVVTDVMTVSPRSGVRPEDLDELVRYGKEFLRAKGAKVAGSQRLKMAGNDAVEVFGAYRDRAYSIRLFYRGRRKFEFRCLAPASDGGWPCESAFASFEVLDPPDPQAQEAPRLLHLRDARFGFEFDAPDDSWLAVGPRTAGGGAQVVWIWRNSQAQIDVQALDLSLAGGNAPDEATFAQKMAEADRAKGYSVKVERSTLAGLPCHHLVVDRPDGWQLDLFMLHHGTTNYMILVTQKPRNAALIKKALKGFRLVAR